jgi:hypothetical protein
VQNLFIEGQVAVKDDAKVTSTRRGCYTAMVRLLSKDRDGLVSLDSWTSFPKIINSVLLGLKLRVRRLDDIQAEALEKALPRESAHEGKSLGLKKMKSCVLW